MGRPQRHKGMVPLVLVRQGTFPRQIGGGSRVVANQIGEIIPLKGRVVVALERKRNHLAPFRVHKGREGGVGPESALTPEAGRNFQWLPTIGIDHSRSARLGRVQRLVDGLVVLVCITVLLIRPVLKSELYNAIREIEAEGVGISVGEIDRRKIGVESLRLEEGLNLGRNPANAGCVGESVLDQFVHGVTDCTTSIHLTFVLGATSKGLSLRLSEGTRISSQGLAKKV